MADHLAYLALEDAGIVTEDAAAQRIREFSFGDPDALPLPSYERPGPGLGDVYLLLHLGAAEATAGMDDVETVTALSRFCADAGSGRPWREAFRQHLGRDVEQVYAAVEQRRRSER
jgi:hypothetical protein